MATYDIKVRMVDGITGEVIYESKPIPFTVGCHDKSIFNIHMDSFMRGLALGRSLCLCIDALPPKVVQLDIF